MVTFNLDLNLTDSQAGVLIQGLARHLYRDEAWECVKPEDARYTNTCDCFDCKPLTAGEFYINHLADSNSIPTPRTLLEVYLSQIS